MSTTASSKYMYFFKKAPKQVLTLKQVLVPNSVRPELQSDYVTNHITYSYTRFLLFIKNTHPCVMTCSSFKEEMVEGGECGLKE